MKRQFETPDDLVRAVFGPEAVDHTRMTLRNRVRAQLETARMLRRLAQAQLDITRYRRTEAFIDSLIEQERESPNERYVH